MLTLRTEFQGTPNEAGSWRCGGVASLSWPDLQKGPAYVGGHNLVKVSALYLVSPHCHFVVISGLAVVPSREWEALRH